MTTHVDGSQLSGKAKEAFVEEMFDNIAVPYDRLNRVCSFWRDGAWRRRLVRMIGLKSGHVAVDLGTGTGDLALSMLPVVGEGGRVIGIDLSSKMLNVARSKFAAIGAEATNYTLTIGNAEATGLDSNSADVITMGWVLRNVGNRDAVYQEVLRVLKPGGRFGIIEMSQPDNRLLRFLSRLYIRVVMPLLIRMVGGRGDAYDYLASSTLKFPMKDSLTREWRDAGLQRVQSHSLMFGSIAIHVGTKENTE
ncbi:MAG: ubiquinone/menaquinone biosynthesis methyltransferase [Pirellulaceae bacterium]|nr:ubiquinone/menaquinone biosynthesis methyltransferase [Pirellulaceae bacterium]